MISLAVIGSGKTSMCPPGCTSVNTSVSLADTSLCVCVFFFFSFTFLLFFFVCLCRRVKWTPTFFLQELVYQTVTNSGMDFDVNCLRKEWIFLFIIWDWTMSLEKDVRKSKVTKLWSWRGSKVVFICFVVPCCTTWIVFIFSHRPQKMVSDIKCRIFMPVQLIAFLRKKNLLQIIMSWEEFRFNLLIYILWNNIFSHKYVLYISLAIESCNCNF